MNTCYVIGSPIAHSLSPVLHTAGYEAYGIAAEWTFLRHECVAEEVADFISHLDSSVRGVSVTMPCKFVALDVADEVSDRGATIGSANTLVHNEDGTWFADNTDCEGILGALEELGVAGTVRGRDAVVIGGGGTSRPALWALGYLGASGVTVVNRTDKSDELRPIVGDADFHYVDYSVDLASLTSDAAVVISTVPSVVLTGKEEDIAQCPVLDVIYDPRPTPLATAARKKGCSAVEGNVMLSYQSFSQFEQYTGLRAPRDAMRNALDEYLAE
ncbi:MULTISPECIES: shikimate dehydrogenase [Corynebacterium]|uniref:shikimate dehydrogenase n=1 Tax=Corynebacterium TaxID=1716 RepID=UPI0008A1045E|nr:MULTISPECIES: shikimate dehydrogenase [Corynebacterium]MCT1442651.1 shikimate dehydrogenase [Corynebacterium glucuronolyticum]OFO48229.1 shikimate dehydrogenase [Corynebacterium sp. HMSC073D01]